MPAALETFAAVEVEYETMPGWDQDISTAKTFEELPKNCQVQVFYNIITFSAL